MKGIINILLIVCLGFSCSGQNSELQKEDKEIISKLIDELAVATPPPPSMDSSDTIIPQRIIDSLLSIKLRVGLYPTMFNDIEPTGLRELPETFKKLVNTTPQKFKKIPNLNGIESLKGHQIILVDTTKIKEWNNFADIDLLYHFSYIRYGIDKMTAVLEVAIRRGRMDGIAFILCLEKQQGEWSIQCVIPTSFS